ncbi:peptidoglycan editing factor PgeF [Pseudalkalibacillus caeni]|uniref:Purine nucleoside phosphorylase n=1 Tax=Exobacillus caeni TaxID=2574798 RepID=A0A5R9F621_9BACL|nr:peptidoglycan editing factor PgeF [Pseudalkalibacillus caeni]TLS35255.1 peptidoglycan editing factor PgeF [Pseudalkalibacillus caeni]
MSKEPFQQKDPSYYELTEWVSENKLVAGITTRKNGYSDAPYTELNMGLHVGDKHEHVLKNREHLADLLSFRLDHWVISEQVHGGNIQKVGKKERGNGARNLDTVIPSVDGLYTNEPEVMLGAFYADCVPIFFYSPDYSYVGIAHAGWRGTTENIAGNMVNAWKKEGVPADRVYAVIGPSIGSCCYEVDQNVSDAVRNVLRNQEPFPFTEHMPGKFMLDLKEANRLILANNGIPEDQIFVTEYCTGCQTDIFYSHRNEGGKTGRMLSFIGLREA